MRRVCAVRPQWQFKYTGLHRVSVFAAAARFITMHQRLLAADIHRSVRHELVVYVNHPKHAVSVLADAAKFVMHHWLLLAADILWVVHHELVVYVD